MKAMYIKEPGQVEFTEVDKPVRKKGEVLLKLLYGGICGSDLGSYKGTFAYFDYPRIPGHEFSAEIIEADENNEQGLRPGMIVTCNPYFNCGHCYSCKKWNCKCVYGQPDHGMPARWRIPGIYNNARGTGI